MNRGAGFEQQTIAGFDMRPNIIDIAYAPYSSHAPGSPLRVMGIDGEGLGPSSFSFLPSNTEGGVRPGPPDLPGPSPVSFQKGASFGGCRGLPPALT
jgi:hypothetical protein